MSNTDIALKCIDDKIVRWEYAWLLPFTAGMQKYVYFSIKKYPLQANYRGVLVVQGATKSL